MGKGKLKDGGGSLTEDDFLHMAKKWGMSPKETKEEVFKLLKKELSGK